MADEAHLTVEQLEQGLRGELDAEGQSRLDVHLQACPGCLDVWRRLREEEGLVGRMLAVQPDPRYQTPGEIGAALEQWTGSSSVVAPTGSTCGTASICCTHRPARSGR